MHSALLSGDPHDQLAIAYHLIVDNKRIADEAAKAELRGGSIEYLPSQYMVAMFFGFRKIFTLLVARHQRLSALGT